MKVIRGIKIGGLQQKIFNLILIFILVLFGAYAALTAYQQKNLSAVVQEAGAQQQASIESVSRQTMETVLETSVAQTTALQAYLADDLFGDVRTDVLTLQAFATELFEHADSFAAHPVDVPRMANDGEPAVMLIHEEGVDPAGSEKLGLVGNMSEIMLAMYEASDKLNSIFVGTADGNMVLVNDRSGTYISQDGSPLPLDIRHRPWYTQAAEAGELIFTGVELDAYTDTLMLECAAPVYHNGELVAVVSADVYLSVIRDYVESRASEGSFVCVINGNGQVLFSPEQQGIFKAAVSAEAQDLRRLGNGELTSFIEQALRENTGLRRITVNGEEYYMVGSPLPTVGWAVLAVVEKALTDRPAEVMLAKYDEINDGALAAYRQGAGRSVRVIIAVTVVIFVLAIAAALVLGVRIVRPLEKLTKRINAQMSGGPDFTMDDAYRTDDEIEILAEAFASLTKRTQDYIREIITVTAENKRVSTELTLANRIQADMLPNIYPAFPDRPEFDIYATMTPAREVGGDFYDFFLVDDDHLCMVMADVSGKGVPAALFMMASKIILANNAMQGKSPAQILTDVNAAICSNNREEMFVTVWLGILEISTGKLTAANAGHEYPIIRFADGRYELFKDKHGFVIGGMDGMRYKEYTLQLDPGARLFVYTDGVPEATNERQELFGTERLLAALNAAPDADPVTVLKNVKDAVDGFVVDAEQFDDLTMLCLKYIGDGRMNRSCKELEISAEVEKLPEVLSFVEHQLEEIGCPMKAQMQIAVAAEEIFVNIASYAYAPGTGKAIVRMECDKDPAVVRLSFLDSGVPFDPLAKEDPDVSLSAEERLIGGLGIYMTKKTMDDVRYEYRDGQNRLTLIKKI